jgi:hypothetical protein
MVMSSMDTHAYQVAQNLVADDFDHVEARPGADGVDDHVAMDADEVLGLQN